MKSQSTASPAKKENNAKGLKPAKVVKPKGDKKGKAPANLSKCKEVIAKSIADLKEREGSSCQAILEYIMVNFKVVNDAKVVNMHLKQALKCCFANEIVINPKGTGVTGYLEHAKSAKAKKNKKTKKQDCKAC
ncbi:histone H1-delta-like [Artemia franciscana]|uniref:histone H1-delta-like n=1 Tax=Artemia franciscana TaxID=6661 RepID=UPI0032DA9021